MPNQYTKNIVYGDNFVIYKYPQGDIRIDRDDLYEFYIVQNHSKEVTCLHYGVTDAQLTNCINRFNCKKPGNLAALINKQTKLERYGDASYNNSTQTKQTCLSRYGVDNIFKDIKYIESCRRIKLGVEYPAQDQKIMSRIVSKRKANYGEHLEKLVQKQKQTNQSRYGVNFQMQREEIKESFRNNEQSRIKAWETKKKNGTTNTSKEEEHFYSWLIERFSKEDVRRNYICSRYPYHVDFYIVPIDCFIELNLFWTHGNHPFNSTDPEDISTLETFKHRATEHPQYLSAINVWTIKDPDKQKLAKENGLFYLMAYNSDDIEKIKEELSIVKECY